MMMDGGWREGGDGWGRRGEFTRLGFTGLICARTTEGSWDDVMRLIGQAHVMLHERGVLRIQTDIRIGSR